MIVTARSTTAPQKPDVFGTVALDAGVTAYGARWRRVSAADLADPRLRTRRRAGRGKKTGRRGAGSTTTTTTAAPVEPQEATA